MKRILLVGTSGCGKTTLAQQLAMRLGLPFYPTDPLYWQSDWRPAPIEQVDRRLDEILQSPDWVLDGNFEHRWQHVWPQADCVIWLDYSLRAVLWQVASRNLRWWARREKVWSGDAMPLGRALSGIRHTLKSHAAKRRRYPEYLADLDGVCVRRFANRMETEAWVATLDRV